ncbi:MAG: hypothetical protein K2X81_27225, partial [Candidatus Obscuribacterales bacterium]|nr:hypothetical protein [Candidatus Obscuribacterales bacterium]
MNRTTHILSCLGLFLPSAISLCSMAEAADAKGKIAFITAQAFKKEVVQSAQPVMLDVCGTWCAPCKTMSPIVERLA